MTSDLTAAANTIAHDPLVGGFALIAAGVLIGRLLFKQKPMWRAVSRIIFLALLTLLLLYDGIVPYRPLEITGTPYRDTIAGTLKIAWWLWAAWFFVALVRTVVILEGLPREGRLIQDILSALIYIGAAFAIVAYVFDLPVQGLLATSGVIAIVLGLALQSSLNDVFSGLVLSLSRPYRPGDWVKFDGGTEGRIVELNWRATHILTARQDLAIVPNSTIAKSKIVNVNYPSSIHGSTIEVRLSAPPSSGKAILELALINSRLILTYPSPTVVVSSVDARQTQYEVTYFLAQQDSDVEAQNELFDLIFRHTVAAGARLAPPKEAPYQPLDDQPLRLDQPNPGAILDLAEIFVSLTPNERAEIVAKLKPASHEKGDILVKPGEVLQSLFIVGGGVLEVTRSDAGGEQESRFAPGDYFGAMGLLTGTPAGATIAALTPSVVYELAKADIRPILETRPEIAQELCRAVARRLAAGRALERSAADTPAATKGVSAWLSIQMHRLFELKGAN
jgi:small-conductance mechanosensitive channel/CRP-like cAMP-binding protein